MNGGACVAAVLKRHGVEHIFTLCGGHISPILVECKRLGIRVVDVRHEVTAVFAADAVARITGVPGIAAVTAGPGLTNTITAVKNAQLAQSPLVLLGGATATLLRGRGSLQDIDQIALIEPHVKRALRVTRLRDLAPALERALYEARAGVPGPVFIECPVDLLYDESIVRTWYQASAGTAKPARGLRQKALGWYIQHHLSRLFRHADRPLLPARTPPAPLEAGARDIAHAAERIRASKRPVLVIGSQAMLDPLRASDLLGAVERLGMPTYLTGMSRGLLGTAHPLQRRHRRRESLREADLVLLAGAPNDFRLDYGRQISTQAYLIGANRSRKDLFRNRRPDLACLAAPDLFLRTLAADAPYEADQWQTWLDATRLRDQERDADIAARAGAITDAINPLRLCQELEATLSPQSTLVADGGDFVSTAAYIVRPRGPLTWLDPGVFGTLGVGAGFALGAKLCRPGSDVWILYGDGSVGYSLSEFDTFVRHGVPVIGLVGNDACWSQIAREQLEILGDDVATVLGDTDYHDVVRGFGAAGLTVDRPEHVRSTLREAQRLAREGQPVLVNARIGQTDFRKGSISI